jgi:hypothetical protein
MRFKPGFNIMENKKRAAPAAQEEPGPFKSDCHYEKDYFFCTIFRGISKNIFPGDR